ncbi:hypothetical protein BHE74_00050732 [Ensete ventricosum]|nr:hypothetical protein BHE74_00050732 [Ensete ventricosum]
MWPIIVGPPTPEHDTPTSATSLSHITVSPSRTYVGCRPGFDKVNWKIQNPNRSAGHLTTGDRQHDSTTGGMTEQTRWANKPTTPLTTGNWQHGRADATSRPTCSTPDSRRLVTWQKRIRWANQLATPLIAGDYSVLDTVAITWPAYNELTYAGINTPKPSLLWGP